MCYHPFESKQFKTFDYISMDLRVSTPTAQTVLTDIIPILGPCHFPEILGQKGKRSHQADSTSYQISMNLKKSFGTFILISLADPRGGARDAPPPRGSKFFHFHAVFGKNVKNNSNFGSWRPPRGKSWIRHWILMRQYSNLPSVEKLRRKEQS